MSTHGRWNARALARITKATVEDADRQFEIIQPLIDYIKYGRETEENVRRESLDRADVASKMYDTESAKFEKEAEEGAGDAETTRGFGQEGETRFRTVEDEKLSPEEKERQRKLKDNAKAIRRLHNVKSNYPIAALRNLGFALETQEQREEHDRLFAERDAISGRQNAVSAEVNPQSMTLMERITESLMKAAVQNKENVDMRMSAIRAYGRDLSNVLKLMRAQRGYDRKRA